jgi:CRP-like cAMP-binding protein/Fe-S-cluster-containing hydrogenase component 2
VTSRVQFPFARFREVPLLREVDRALYDRLSARNDAAENLYECHFGAGEYILREGEYCDGAYYLVTGVVEVRFRGTPGPERQAIAPRAGVVARLRDRLRPRKATAPPRPDTTVVLPELPIDLRPGDRAILGSGEIFGEGSALSRFPIATDIVAVSSVTCLLVRTPLLRVLLEQPEFRAFKQTFDTRYRERTLRAHLRRVAAFEDLEPEVLDALAECAELVTFKPDKTIALQGDSIDALYLVRGGYVKVGQRVGGSEVAVTYLRRGEVAGEFGLLLDEPWPYSLTALENVELVKLPLARVRAILSSSPAVERRLWSSMTAVLKQRSSVTANPLATETLQFAMDSGLIHGESVFMIDLETCTRCDDCVRACADAHGGIPRFVREGSRFRNFSVPTACYQCTDPVCMIGCPTGAITRPLGTMEVVIDAATCIGCGNCGRRCPWDNIQSVEYDSPKTGTRIDLATKCDLCFGRTDGPACVQMCPHGAAVRVNFKQREHVEELLAP